MRETDELDLERQFTKLQDVEISCKKIIKHAKKYEENLAFLCKSEVKLTNDFCSSVLCQTDSDLREIIENWHTVAVTFEQLYPELSLICDKAVVDPIKRYQNFFSGVNSSLKKRESLLQECHKCQAKLEKLIEKEKTAQNLVKIDQAKKALVIAKEEFLNQNSILLQELPLLYETRIQYFQPCLEALIRGQVSYYGECANAVRDLTEGTSIKKMTNPNGDSIERTLMEIKNLSIVADD
ncbi:Bridging integrator 3 [Nymphon striatum]|nr:Bridging integrator 3 [Nymphon striatum]